MSPDDLLARLAVTLRNEIGPAVADPFPKTQAFMAAVILEKLSAQLRLAPAHERAEQADRAELLADLEQMVGTDGPPRLRQAVDRLATAPGPSALSALIEALYAERDALGAQRFEDLLGRVRRTLRARIDRQLEYAA